MLAYRVSPKILKEGEVMCIPEDSCTAPVDLAFLSEASQHVCNQLQDGQILRLALEWVNCEIPTSFFEG